MPLKKGTSKRSFRANVETEARSKPIKQALAIAYAVQRRAKAKKRARSR